MTSQLEAAIAAIQPLTNTERQQLMQILASRSSILDELQDLSSQFQEGASLEQLRAQQQPKTVKNLAELKADFWPPEDSIEDFLDFLSKTRRDGVSVHQL
ncbi:hypothetical protein IQ266_10575 [filamentous cyanobacterium LEGE 11480]|uniref:Uncharacterized protein n=2 Tax=Romeriopsis TaxID=2992131 RepID=A0A928VM02_9CYAN|nr:hypothetical protein [Romeriopsis navalis LEGE 11480]